MVKNNSITFWRLVFTIAIALFHFLRLYGYNTGWYTSVEFFFMTSGFLLIYAYEKNQIKQKADPTFTDSPWKYTKKRIARLYPMYLFCFIINFFVYSRLLYPTVGMKLKALYESIYEVLGIFMVGLNLDIMFNNVAWYVSALLIVGYFIYYMLLHHRKFYIQFICPLTVILIYSFYYRIYTGLEMWGDSIGFFQHDALLRALAGMNMGILSYQLCNKISETKFTKLGRYLLDIAEISGFVFILVYELFIHNTDDDYAAVIVMAVCIALAFSHRECNSLFNNKVINYFSGLTYAMYLNHGILISVFKRLWPDFSYLTPIAFFGILLVVSIISKYFVDFACSFCKNKIVPLLKYNN